MTLHHQGCTSTLDTGHTLAEFAECPFDFSVERTNVPLCSCQCGHWLIILTHGQYAADPTPGCLHVIRVYIQLVSAAMHLFVSSQVKIASGVALSSGWCRWQREEHACE